MNIMMKMDETNRLTDFIMNQEESLNVQEAVILALLCCKVDTELFRILTVIILSPKNGSVTSPEKPKKLPK